METLDAELHDLSSLDQNEVRQEADTLSTHSNTNEDREIGEMDEEDYSEHLALELNEELRAGYKILLGLMAWSLKHVNWPFMESVETTDPELYESYRLVIKRPMWLKQSKNQLLPITLQNYFPENLNDT